MIVCNSLFNGEVTRARPTHVTVVTVVCDLTSTVEQHGLLVLCALCRLNAIARPTEFYTDVVILQGRTGVECQIEKQWILQHVYQVPGQVSYFIMFSVFICILVNLLIILSFTVFYQLLFCV